MTRSDARLVALGAVLAGLVLCGLLLHRPGADTVGSALRARVFVAVLAVAAAVHLGAAGLVLRERSDRTLTLFVVLAVALLARVPALLGPPFLSSDLFRYVWDGRVQLAGINPYRYIPADPALAFLRDHAIFDHVNRRFYAHTIYPPAAQLLFRGIAAISQTPLAVRLDAVGWEAVAVLCLAATLRRCGIPRARVLLYAWNPLAIWSFAGNGHVDAEAVGLIAMALLARAAGRDGWAGVALGAATLVKFLPVVIGPALWRGRWRLPFAGACTIVALYLPFIAIGPRRVLGFVAGYGGEEGLSDGHGLWLLAGLDHVVPLGRGAVPVYGVIALLALGTVALLAARNAVVPDADRAVETRRVAGWAGLLAALTILVASPHYSWYFPFLGVFAVLRPSRALLWLSVAPLVLILSPWHEFFVWPSLVYAPAIILFVVDETADLRRRAMRAPRERTAQ